MRRLAFRAQDDAPERWRAVGFAIGTIVGRSAPEPDGVMPQRRAEPPRPAVAAPLAEAPPPPSSESVREAVGSLRGVFGLAATASPISSSGPWMGGGRVRGAVGDGSWPLLASLAAAYTWQLVPEQSIRSEWMTLAAGAFVPLPTSGWPVLLDVRLEALLRQQRFTSTPPDGTRDDDQRWVGGVRAGVDGAWEIVPHLGLGIGLDFFYLGGATTIRQYDAEVYELDPYGFEASFGTRLAW